MHSKSSLWQEDEIIDTKKLQIHSLKEMMAALGYQYEDNDFFTGHPYFYSYKYSNKGRNVISMKSAIDLYNNQSVKCIFGKPPAKLSIWSFDDHSVAKAKAARILRSIKIQYCYQTRNIIVQDHRVKFCLESYKALYLNNKYL